MAAAVAAELPPYVTDLARPRSDLRTIGNAWSIERFDGPFYVTPGPHAGRPACSLVFVQSADGNTGADNPGSLGGGNTDLHLIYEGLSRVACDAVLAGAKTVQGSRMVLSVWHPEMVRLRSELGLPRHPVQIVATLNGMNLDDALLFNVPELRVILLTCADGASRMEKGVRARPWIDVLTMRGPNDLPGAFEQLRQRAVRSISCIGGRTLARALLDAGLVDDVYLTTAARPGGEPHTPLHDRPWRGPLVLRKHGTRAETGVVFEHITPGGTISPRETS
jgi:riboflavin biosynthesis pyrimidine reductase